MFSNDAIAPVHPMFLDAVFKAKWAAHNINNLNAILDNYIKTSVRSSVVEASLGQASHQFVVFTDPMMVPIPMIVGDIIRNLRGALEYVIAAMCRAAKKREDLMYFPTGTDRQSYAGIIKGGIEKHWPALGPLFRDDIDATEDNNSLIWALNQIDRSVKHRALTVIDQIAVTPLPNYFTAEGGAFIGNVIGIKPGQCVSCAIPTAAEIVNYANVKMSIDVTFGPSELLSGKDVVLSLADFHDVVTETIAKISKAYVAAYL